MIDLLVGRESGVENPRLAIYVNGQVLYHGAPGSVPKNVSRKHCHIIIGNDAILTVEDITDNNFLFINGTECKKKSGVKITDTIELGPSKYRLDTQAIAKVVSLNQSFSIKHLEDVFNTYQKTKFDLQVKERKLNAISAFPGIMTMISIGAAFFFQNQYIRIWSVVFAAVFGLIFALIRFKYAKGIPLQNRKYDDEFREKYVCPNPACNRYLGQTPYKELIKNRSCPYCKSNFTDQLQDHFVPEPTHFVE